MCQGASKSNWNSAMSPPLFLPKFLELKSEEHSNILLNFALLGEHDSFCLFFSKAQTRASKDGSTHPMLRDLLETHYGSHQFCISKKNILPAHVWSPICTKFKAPEVMSLQYLKSKLRKCWSMSWENLIGLWHIFLSFKLHVSLGVQFQYIYIYMDELCSHLIPIYEYMYIYIFLLAVEPLYTTVHLQKK